MLFRTLAITLLITAGAVAKDNPIQAVIDQALEGFKVVASAKPYSQNIERIYLGLDQDGQPSIGIAFRKIESFKILSAVVIVEKTPKGYVLREVLFPDIGKIQNSKDRTQVLSILNRFKDVPFDPHAEKSAVDGLTGATRHMGKIGGYLNHMARRIAMEMEEQSGRIKPKSK